MVEEKYAVNSEVLSLTWTSLGLSNFPRLPFKLLRQVLRMTMYIQATIQKPTYLRRITRTKVNPEAHNLDS